MPQGIRWQILDWAYQEMLPQVEMEEIEVPATDITGLETTVTHTVPKEGKVRIGLFIEVQCIYRDGEDAVQAADTLVVPWPDGEERIGEDDRKAIRKVFRRGVDPVWKADVEKTLRQTLAREKTERERLARIEDRGGPIDLDDEAGEAA